MIKDNNFEWYESCGMVKGAYAMHRASMEILAALKPHSKTNGVGTDYSTCSHEMLPTGVAQTIGFIDSAEIQRSGIHTKPGPGYRVCDIGFGVGGFLLAAMMYTHKRGWIMSGVERDGHLVDTYHEWLSAIINLMPATASEMNELKTNCIKGEIKPGSTTTLVTQCVQQANTVFVNNFLFGDMTGRGASEGSFNGTIALILCGCEVGTWVITTGILDATHNGRKLQLWKHLTWKRHSFSWTANEVGGYMYHVVACE